MTSMRSHRAVISALLVAGMAALGAGGSDQPKSASSGSTSSTPPPPPAANQTQPATGHEGHDMSGTTKDAPDKGKRMTITGEVMDPACFLEAGAKSIGPGHYQCAVDCARSGQTLAIYDRQNDRIYFIAGELPGKNPNDPVINFIHKKVDVTGMVYHRAGAYGIVITKVVLHEEKPAGTTPATGAAAAGK